MSECVSKKRCKCMHLYLEEGSSYTQFTLVLDLGDLQN